MGSAEKDATEEEKSVSLGWVGGCRVWRRGGVQLRWMSHQTYLSTSYGDIFTVQGCLLFIQLGFTTPPHTHTHTASVTL